MYLRYIAEGSPHTDWKSSSLFLQLNSHAGGRERWGEGDTRVHWRSLTPHAASPSRTQRSSNSLITQERAVQSHHYLSALMKCWFEIRSGLFLTYIEPSVRREFILNPESIQVAKLLLPLDKFSHFPKVKIYNENRLSLTWKNWGVFSVSPLIETKMKMWARYLECRSNYGQQMFRQKIRTPQRFRLEIGQTFHNQKVTHTFSGYYIQVNFLGISPVPL